MGRGIKLRITPMVLIAGVGLVLSDQSGLCLMTLIAALLHECGHLLMARLLGISFAQMRIDFTGARLDVQGRLLSYGEEWLLAAAGPFFSLLFAAIAAPLWRMTGYAYLFSCSSLLLGVLNLLPIRTFDGGRMLECSLALLSNGRLTACLMRGTSFLCLLLLWGSAVYFLLRAGDGISLLCFSMTLFFRFFDEGAL